MNEPNQLFGTFRAELWEDGEYVITCKAGPIGQTMNKHTAKWLEMWMNGAINEALRKLKYDEFLNGEYICPKCGLREEGKFVKGDF